MTTDPIDLKKPHRPIRVGVILVNSETEILDVAPIDVFSGLSKRFVNTFPDALMTPEMKKQALDVEFHWVNETGEVAFLTAGGQIKPTHTFKDCPRLDVAMMGAHEMGYTLSRAEVAFVRKTYEECNAFMFICGGFIAALQSGLLEGKTATCPRPMVPMMKQAHPEVKWVAKRYANDGKIWTSGALLNGTDMTRAFATQTWGDKETDMAEVNMRLGGYPVRDIDYADVPWDV